MISDNFPVSIIENGTNRDGKIKFIYGTMIFQAENGNLYPIIATALGTMYIPDTKVTRKELKEEYILDNPEQFPLGATIYDK